MIVALIIKPNTFFPGTIIRSSEVNADLDTIYNEFNGNINQANLTTLTGTVAFNNPGAPISIDFSSTAPSTDIELLGAGSTWFIQKDGAASFSSIAGPGAGVPVGTILPWYDYGILLLPSGFLYCDGTVIATVGSPIIGQTLPDLSDRYLVGFGTDGGGDIGTAPFVAPPVGNSNHEINIAHSHTVAAHTHTSVNHSHAAGLLTTDFITTGGARDFTVGAGILDIITEGSADQAGNHTHNVSGITDFTMPGPTGSSSPSTNSQLSTTQSIQPRSIRCRFIMRVI